MLRFSDGVNVDTSGPLRPRCLRDGWYVVGQGMMMPVDNVDDAREVIAEMTPRDNKLRVGARVRLSTFVDYYPYFYVREGSTGVVDAMEDGVAWVRMDGHVEGAEEWGNRVEFSPESAKRDLEVI